MIWFRAAAGKSVYWQSIQNIAMDIKTLQYRIAYVVICLFLIGCQTEEKAPLENQPVQPNVIIFYVDDLGYGDLGSYGAQGVATPYVDQLAENGIRFTDAHSPASTCTPSRYSLLTGELAFRRNAQILPGDAPLLIDTASQTLPLMFKRAGYRTAVVGKWHLGLGLGEVNWNDAVSPGPLEVGFDYSYLLPATGDRVPTVYLKNHHVENLDPSDPITVSYKEKLDERPTGLSNPELLRFKADTQHSQTIINGVSRIGTMSGGEDALWVDEEFPEVFSGQAKKFIDSAGDDPFFLFFSFHDIHVPRLPHEQFQGASTMGPRGDAIAQMDWTTGQVVNYLKEKGIVENTLIIFTSDNGPVLDDGYDDQAEELLGDHDPAGGYRGGKYSIFEAGTRVPTIVSWPGTISEGESDALFSQTDFYASLASLVGVELGEDEAVDSQNILAALLDHTKAGNTWLVEEGFTLALRKGDWKYIAPLPENRILPDWIDNKGVEGGLARIPQLYNLADDPGETQNIAKDKPELLEDMRDMLHAIQQESIRELIQQDEMTASNK
jgi:arylsulfatase A